VLIILVGGGVFLYLNPDYRDQTTAWVSDHLRTAKQKMNSFERQKPAPARPQDSTLANLPRSTPDPIPGADSALVAADRVLKAPVTKPDDAASQALANSLAATPTTHPTSPPPTPTTLASGTQGSAGQANDLIKSQTKREQTPRRQASQPEDNSSNTSASSSGSGKESQPQTKAKPPQPQAPPPEVAIGPRHDEEPPKRIVETMTEEQAMEKSRQLRLQAMDAETAGDYAKALRLLEQIKTLQKSVWPGDLQIQIDYAKSQVDQK